MYMKPYTSLVYIADPYVGIVKINLDTSDYLEISSIFKIFILVVFLIANFCSLSNAAITKTIKKKKKKKNYYQQIQI
jgi:hypothetical protein